MCKRTQFLHTIFIIILFVGTLSSFGFSYLPSVGKSEGYLAKAEYDNTISEPSGKSLELLGQYDENIGTPYSTYIEGDFLYTTGPNLGLVKMDISDATQPNILGIHRNESDYYFGYEFCVKDNIAYFADINYLRVVDITDINNVVELARITDFDSQCTNVKAYGNTLIVSDYVGFIRFYDITNPANMVLQNSLNLTQREFRPQDYDYVNDTLYIIGENYDDNSTLVIYDVSNINSPVYLGNYSTPYESRGEKVIIDESIAYVLNEYDFQVLNITTPALPTLIYSANLTQDYHYLLDMILVDEIMYLLNKSTLITLDVSNSSEISILDIDSEYLYLFDFVLKDNHLYITNPYYQEIIIYETLIPSNPQKVSTFSFGGYCNEVCVKNKIAYIANRTNGTRILDVSDAKNPRLIGSYFDGDSIDFVQVSGQILYATSYENCLKLIDVSDPSNPILLSEYRSENNYANYIEAKVSKNKVYLGHGNAGLEIIDVTDSSNPTLLGSYIGDTILNIKLKNNFLLIGMIDLRILDVSDPTHIQLVSSLSFEDDFVTDIALEGDRAYLLSSYWGIERIRVVNIADPNRPKNIGSTRIDFRNINNIEVSGDYLYLASIQEGLIVLKNTFDRLSYVGQSSDENNYGLDLVVEKGFVYMASGWDGLTIFKAFTSVRLALVIIIPVVIVVVVIVFVLVFRVVKTRRR